MAKQRAVMTTLGPKIIPFRDRVEEWVAELAGDGLPDVVSTGVSLDTISAGPGVYLRARVSNAKTVRMQEKKRSNREKGRIIQTCSVAYAQQTIKQKYSTRESKKCKKKVC